MADLRSGADALPQVPRVAMSAQSLATDVSRKGSAIGQTQVAQNKSLPPEEWTGAAADAASSEIQKLGEKTVKLSEAFPPASTALNTWADAVNSTISSVTDLQKEWDEAVSTYNKAVEDAEAQYKAKDPGFLSGLLYGDRDQYMAPGSPLPHSRSEERQEAINAAETALTSSQTDIHNRYVTALNKLDDSAQTAANDINNARRNIVSDTAGSGGRTSVGAALFPAQDMPYTSSAATWEDAQKIAPEIAEALAKEPMSIEDLKAFNEKYGHYLSNPFYATALAQHVSMDDIYKAAITASDAGYRADPSNPNSASYVFNRNLGSLMVMATGGSNLSTEMWHTQKAFDMLSGVLVGKDGATVSEIVQTKLEDLQATGRNTYPVQKLPSGATEVSLQGYDIFGQLAGYAGRVNTSLVLGPEFYDNPNQAKSVFTDMVEWDYETHGSSRARQLTVGPQFNSLIPMDGSEKDQHHLDSLQGILELSDTPDRMTSDEISLPREVEDRRLEALRNALDRDVTLQREEDSSATSMNTTRYLTGSRGYAEMGESAFFDGGEALGDMLNDAARPSEKPVFEPSPSDYPLGADDPAFKHEYERFVSDQKRARIAQNLLLGYQDGLDHDERLLDKGEDRFGHANAKTRSWIGTILAPRVDDLAAILDTARSDGTPATGNQVGLHGHAQMNLDNDTIKRMFASNGLFTDLAHDQPTLVSGGSSPDPSHWQYAGGRRPALQALQTAAWTGYRYRLGELINGTDETSTNFTANVSNNTSGWRMLIEGLDQAPARAEIPHHDQIEARNKLIRGFIDFGMSKVPATGTMQEAIMAAVGQGKDSIYDKYLSTDMTAQELTKAINDRAEETTKFNMAVEGAFVDSDNWVNSAGMTKQQLLDQFIHDKGYGLGVSPGMTVENMTPAQREGLIDYLKKETPGGSMSALKDLEDASDIDKSVRAHFWEACEAAAKAHH
ncbi:hypothetical protein [Actinomyces sp.]